MILDGNRRLAKANGKTNFNGHRQGFNNLKDIVEYAVDNGIKFVSAFVFSTYNSDRSKAEFSYLMNLSYRLITRDVKTLNEKKIKAVWLGSKRNLSDKLLSAIAKAEESTANNTRGTFCFCFNYGGQEELSDAAKQIVKDNIAAEDITPQTIADRLYAPGVPPVDLVIRTSGEQRLSGFMLWRIAYSEIFFCPKYWPDFTHSDFDEAIEFYKSRERRFGR